MSLQSEWTMHDPVPMGHEDELAAANRTIEQLRRELLNLRNRVNIHNRKPKNQRQEFV